MLSCDSVDFVRDRRRILAGVDWQVRAGQRWIVLGPNGAGKSTLLRLASTYELPTRGRVHVLGHRVGGTDLRELRKRIGYVSAMLGRDVARGTSALDAVVTGQDATLRRWHQTYDVSVEDRAAALLEQVGCSHLADTRFDRLSEGERQRVQLARSLMPAPDLVLLDEPSASLDLPGRELLVTALDRLAADQNAAAVVVVTHHVEEIPPGFTHALLLRGGRVLRAGPVDEVVTGPTLSACFGLTVHLDRVNGRFVATAAGHTRPPATPPDAVPATDVAPA